MKRYAIYGAGSLGTVLGTYITKNGGKIDLINRNKAHVAALNETGAHITGTVEMTVPGLALTVLAVLLTSQTIYFFAA